MNMKLYKRITATLVLLAISFELFACTSAIISGRLTPDGRPLMYKHRDTGNLNNRMVWYEGEKYSFLALVNSDTTVGESWMGANEVGFSIMNTASYNIKDDNVTKVDQEGILMYKALGKCKTLKDFEKFLDKYPKPLGVEANFGVIDAYGGAAYYEVNNTKWIKVDVNDARVAPHGYLVYTNFSYTGRVDEGFGYIRYNNADSKFREKSKSSNITPQWIMNNISRSFYNSLMDLDMADVAAQGTGWIPDSDYVPRRSSSASMIIQGVKEDEPLNKSILWTALGYPPITPMVPLFIEAANNQPVFMTSTSEDNANAAICDKALSLKERVFSLNRGSGDKYLNYNALSNDEGNGLMQQVIQLEENSQRKMSAFIRDYHNSNESLNVLKALELQNDVYEYYTEFIL